MNGRLFPAQFGGLDELKTLHRMRQSGAAHHLMRGDGRYMGWFLITEIRETETYLDAKGVGQVIELQVSLTRTDQPSHKQYASVTPPDWALVSPFEVRSATWGDD